jgi:hypothetical protein
MMDFDEPIVIEKPVVSALSWSNESPTSNLADNKMPGSATTTNNIEPVCSFYTDVEGYISRYAPFSETRLQRLLFLASCCSQEEDSSEKAEKVPQQCYEWAEQHCKNNGNSMVYRQVFTVSNHPIATATPACEIQGASGESNPSGKTHNLNDTMREGESEW